MATRYVSPGVFTNEVDASFLGPGVGSIGAALIGTAPKGPAFVPVAVTSFSEPGGFEQMFGSLDSDHMLTYAARAYLANSGVANIVRVLGPSGRTVNGTAVTAGYNAEKLYALTLTSGSGAALTSSVIAIIEVTGSGHLIVDDSASQDQSTFAMYITSSYADDTVSDARQYYFSGTGLSFSSGSANYITKVLNTDPTLFATKGYYLREFHEYAARAVSKDFTGTYSSASVALTAFTFAYNHASTPWLFSQPFAGVEHNLFKIHTLGHGEAENGRFKISIENIEPSLNSVADPYGKFDVVVREFNDCDSSVSLVEQFRGLSLNPKADNYIAKRIGDVVFSYDNTNKKMSKTGNYPNKSSFIRVEMAASTAPAEALPWGFRGLDKPNITHAISGSTFSSLPQLPYVKDLYVKDTQNQDTGGIESSQESSIRMYWGLETQLSGSVAARLVKYPSMTGSDQEFSLKYVSGSSALTLPGTGNTGLSYRRDLVESGQISSTAVKVPGSSTSATTLSKYVAKFTVPLAFGYDGFDRRKADPLNNDAELLTDSQIGTQALYQAIEVVSDPDFIDINLLAVPGVWSTKVTNYAITKVEDRADAFYVMDVTGSSASNAVANVNARNLDTSYAACYYPKVKIVDDVNGGVLTVPASVAALGAIAYNDAVAYPWFAPAGLNRAGLSKETMGFDLSGLDEFLKQSERDDLYNARVNPIAQFPGVNGVIWGQKTLQLKASALDRINVRRLMIKAKKLVASAVRYLVFEPNNAATQTRFRQLVNPILADIQQKNGLEAFKVVMDATTNTPDLVDRNVMYGKIYLVPTRTAEFIVLDFVISPSGATFNE